MYSETMPVVGPTKEPIEGSLMKSLRQIVLFCMQVLLLGGIAVQASAQESPDDLHAFLKGRIGLSKKDISKIDSDVLVRQLAMNEKGREMAVFGIVRMSFPQDVFVSRFRQIDRFMMKDTVHQIGVLSNPPMGQDLLTLQLPQSDFQEMARCRIGNCKVKLPAEALDRLGTIDWSSPHAADSAMELFRMDIVQYLRSYIDNGSSSLMVYADKEKPIKLAAGIELLLPQGTYLYNNHPELMGHIKNFLQPPSPRIEDLFFWSLEDFGQRPTFTITQATIYRKEKEEDATVMIALKQIYASHYFHARLQFLDLVTVVEPGKDAARYLLYLDLLRFDAEINKLNQIVLAKSLQSHTKSWLLMLRNSPAITLKVQ